MGISPLYWGKAGWRFIHHIALNFPDNATESEKQDYLNFLNSIDKVLPCPICGVHFKDNMIKHPPRLDSKREFFNWSVDMHNEVNISQGKPIVSHDDAFNQIMESWQKDYVSNGLHHTHINYLLYTIKRIKDDTLR